MDSLSLAQDFTALASSAVSLELDHVSDDVLEHAVRVVADTVGVIIWDTKRPEIEAYTRGDGAVFQPIAGGEARLLAGRFPRANPVLAAFVNATAGTFLELDEGYRVRPVDQG